MFREDKTHHLWMITGVFVLSSNTALAMGQYPTIYPSSMFVTNVVTVSAGAAWEHAGKTQTFYLTPTIEKTYATDNSTHALADGELFIGKQWRMQQHVLSQLGFAFATTGNAKLSGDIWDDADPAFNNYKYQYKIEHSHFAVKGKLLGDWGYAYSPWISVSLGVGFNRANDYSSEPTIFEAVSTSDFNSNTQIAFTYTIGAGVQKMLTQDWQLGVGYEFADWGKSQLDRAPGQTQGDGLTLNHLFTNSIMMSFTYISS